MKMRPWSSNLVSVVAVSCNNHQQLLRGLLGSLKAQTYRQIEQIVVLNGYVSEIEQDLRKEFPEVSFLANKENLLFCKAQNQGIDRALGEFVLCLNDDLVLETEFIQQLVRAALNDRAIGAVSGYIMRSNRQRVDTTGLFLAKSRRPLERGYGQSPQKSFLQPGYIFGAGGAAPFYRREMLEQIKIGNEYFDEDYGIFYEDLDLAWRAQNRGWKGYYAPLARAYHFRNATVRQMSPKAGFLKRYSFVSLNQDLKLRLLKNRYMTIIKNDSLLNISINLLWVLSYEIKLWLYLIVFEPALTCLFFKDLGFIQAAFKKRRHCQFHFT